MDAVSFLQRDVAAFGKRVHRLGLSASFGLDAAGIEAALERGINYVFWNPTARAMGTALKAVTPRLRDRLIIATGPTFGFFAGSLRKRVETALRFLQTDYLDVFQLYWLGRTSAWTSSVVDELLTLQREGKVRALGASIHDRPRAGKLALDSPLTLFMLRYNAAHPGAEREVFPHLAARKPAVVAYTATDWRRLLKRPHGWKDPVPTAGDCYRFCLSNPHVDVVLCGPANVQQLDENLRALERGPLAVDEMAWMRAFGAKVHG
jgi:aryl-alcohol dehydrogenase-like predicted oxidoreductase